MTTKIVFRGGSWGSTADFCRSAGRNWLSPSYRYNYLGFRVIKEMKEKKIEYRVFRGGSWNGPAGYCRSAYRGRLSPSYRFYGSGFRVIKDMA